ncbi:hypothetical protein L6452_25992 [Arctium lappa]|uniref:Uncharacterized protein n=1 Tax=Arctium lappa TaxID=4217 RepID=A0ACB9ACU4_ARCLA|nr:hypothetical protein L6452_25992 [Arctium lappa]
MYRELLSFGDSARLLCPLAQSLARSPGKIFWFLPLLGRSVGCSSLFRIFLSRRIFFLDLKLASKIAIEEALIICSQVILE